MLFNIIFGLVSIAVTAQPMNVDSLKRLLNRPDDTTKVNVLNNLCWELRNTVPDEAIIYGREALALSEKLSYSHGLIRAYNRVGVILMSQGEYDTAKNFYLEAIKIADEAKNKTGKASSLMNLGNIAFYSNEFPVAVDYFQKASDIYAEIKDSAGIVNCLMNMGAIYFFLGKYDTTLLYQQKGLSLFRARNMKMDEALSLDNIGATYSAKGDFTNSLKNHFEALKILETIDDRRHMATTLGNIGSVYSDQKNFNEALVYFRRSMSLHDEIHNHRDRILSQTNIGVAHQSMKNLDSALIYFRRSLGDAEKLKEDDLAAMAGQGIGMTLYLKKDLPGALGYYQRAEATFRKQGQKDALMSVLNNLAGLHSEMGHHRVALDYANEAYKEAVSSGSALRLQTAYFSLSEVHKRRNEFPLALKYYEEAVKIKDSLFNESKSREIGRLESAHELDTKDKEIALLNKDKEISEAQRARQTIIRNAMAGVLALILLLAFILIRNNRQKQKTNQLLTTKNAEIVASREKAEEALTDLKAAQAQLVQREKMASLGELTAGIAHEIQNPLNFINNFSDVNKEMADELAEELRSGNIDEALKITAEIKENESRINHHGKRADGIVKSMLQHSRFNVGQKELIDINLLADEYLRISYHAFLSGKQGLNLRDQDDGFHKSFEVQLTTILDPSIRKIAVVPQELGRVFLNLFNNAFYSVRAKAMAENEPVLAAAEVVNGGSDNTGLSKESRPEILPFDHKISHREFKPEVAVTSFEKDGFIWLKVSDNGVGVPENIKSKIFQPFFTTKPTGTATGLGLSLSYDIIKAHGGEIKLMDSPIGAEFLIKLPVS